MSFDIWDECSGFKDTFQKSFWFEAITKLKNLIFDVCHSFQAESVYDKLWETIILSCFCTASVFG